MAVQKGARLHSFHKSQMMVLPWGVFTLWLDCGHQGGIGKGGDAVSRRKCGECGGLREVVRAEPRE